MLNGYKFTYALFCTVSHLNFGVLGLNTFDVMLLSSKMVRTLLLVFI